VECFNCRGKGHGAGLEAQVRRLKNQRSRSNATLTTIADNPNAPARETNNLWRSPPADAQAFTTYSMNVLLSGHFAPATWIMDSELLTIYAIHSIVLFVSFKLLGTPVKFQMGSSDHVTGTHGVELWLTGMLLEALQFATSTSIRHL
jgi:hypothetical protein